MPDNPDFLIRQDAIAFRFDSADTGPDHRVFSDVLPLHRIIEHRGQGATRPIDLLAESLLMLQCVKQFHNVRPPDIGGRAVAPSRYHVIFQAELYLSPAPLMWPAMILNVLGR